MQAVARNFSELQSHILGLIPRSKDCAINLVDLQGYTRHSRREIKKAISELRKFYPICSRETCGGGYWIAEDENDIKEFIEMINRRTLGYISTMDCMRNHLSV